MPEPILPPLRRTALDARRFAEVAHAGQLDKAGLPYFAHVAGVAHRTAQLAAEVPAWDAVERDAAEQVAWLHDVIEDTVYGPPELIAEGFSGAVVLGVLGLTKPPLPVPYLDWIELLVRQGDLMLALVKLADVRDNAEEGRLARLAPDVRARLTRKYGPAEDMLTAAAAGLGWRPDVSAWSRPGPAPIAACF